MLCYTSNCTIQQRVCEGSFMFNPFMVNGVMVTRAKLIIFLLLMSECTIPVGIIGSLVAGGLQAQQRQKEKDTQMNSLNWNMIQCESMIQGHSSSFFLLSPC